MLPRQPSGSVRPRSGVIRGGANSDRVTFTLVGFREAHPTKHV